MHRFQTLHRGSSAVFLYRAVRVGVQRFTFAAGLLLALAWATGASAQIAPAETQPSAGQEPAPPGAIPAVDAQGPGQPESSAPAGSPHADPPSRVLRLGLLTGAVSVEPAGTESFTAAELNGVITSGDRVYADPAGTAELQAGQLAVRLGGGADLTVSAMTDSLAQFGLAGGAVHLRSYALDPGTVTELDTPEVATTVLEPGDLRVDADPAGHTTDVAVLSGRVQVDGPGLTQVLTAGQQFRFHGGDPGRGQVAFAEPLAPADGDSLDTLSATRDDLQASGADAASPYVNPDTVGGADLGSYGAWDSSDYGPVWYPVVAVNWRPYCFGHWRYVAPWGWTWVGVEPWAFAPFHYGRWAEIGGRWGWVPGSRVVRSVYAPAMVAFAGGQQFASSLGYPPGNGIAAWFPLGPQEPFFPWYGGSTLYRNRVNASNLYNPNAAEVMGFYNQRAVNVFNTAPQASLTYANRSVATTAVPASSFASGRAVNSSMLRLPAATLATAPVLSRPGATLAAMQPSATAPASTSVVPPALPRPVLATGNGAPLHGAPGAITLFHRAEPTLGVFPPRVGLPLPGQPVGGHVGQMPTPVRSGPPANRGEAPSAPHAVPPAAPASQADRHH